MDKTQLLRVGGRLANSSLSKSPSQLMQGTHSSSNFSITYMWHSATVGHLYYSVLQVPGYMLWVQDVSAGLSALNASLAGSTAPNYNISLWENCQPPGSLPLLHSHIQGWILLALLRSSWATPEGLLRLMLIFVYLFV